VAYHGSLTMKPKLKTVIFVTVACLAAAVCLLFSGKKKNDDTGLAKYRVKVSSEGTTSMVAVLDSQGKPETSDNGKRIANLLLEDLR